METKISHRFLSLFAAVLVAFSLISTVALAAEIQPRIPSCPNGCMGSTYYDYDNYRTDWSLPIERCTWGGYHFGIYNNKVSVCTVCGNREVVSRDLVGKYCENGNCKF